MLEVWACAANMAGFWGPELSKQEFIFRRFSLNMGGLAEIH